MVSKVSTVAFQGVDVLKIDVQVQLAPGEPKFLIVGLPDKAVAESRERIRCALRSVGLGMPGQRLTVNLAPADVQKEGSHYDLPMLLALLEGMHIIEPGTMERYYALGELGLDGTVQPVLGVLPAAITALREDKSLICPHASSREATWVEALDVVAAPNVMSLLNYFKGTQVLHPPKVSMAPLEKKSLDFSDIRGQAIAKRVMEIGAAGGHNVLMSGPPGSGKSMLAERLSTILPSLTAEEALELSMIYSVAGLLKEGRLLRERPFRAPHHSASLPALVGGGVHAKPGEITLAHQGVLFLDELPEFSRNTLESLRQPLETRKVVVARANHHYTYPSKFQFIAAMNPCACGYLGDPRRTCSRAPRCGQQYLSRLSGPLLDRIDLHVTVDAVAFAALDANELSEKSADIRVRVMRARTLQQKRLEVLGCSVNADIPASQVEALCDLRPEAHALLKNAAEEWGLSLRSCHRILKVARTIADLGSSHRVELPHVQEALSYRRRV